MEHNVGAHELILESPLLKLPHELLRTNFKAQQKLVEKEIVIASTSLAHLSNTKDKNTALLKISETLDRLRILKQKVLVLRSEESQHINRSRARIKHMQCLIAPRSDKDAAVSAASQVRLQRLVVEFMLRQGLSESAKQLSKNFKIDALLDLEVFIQSRQIAESLLNHSATECMAWCNDHKMVLRKIKNKLEFELRRQEFIELVRKNKVMDAITFAQKNLSSYRSIYQTDVNQVCALLCYREGTTMEPYKSLYALSRWSALAQLFTQTHQNLYNIPPISPFEVALSAGLSALKTPTCYEAGENKRLKKSISTCPICSPEFNELARGVPFAHAVRSYLVDTISGDPMEGDNEPLVLPNGRIYGAKSLQHYCKQTNERETRVQDPQTKEIFLLSSLRKAYVP